MDGLSRICFVIAPIGDEDSSTRMRSDELLDQAIRPAVAKLSLTALRGDQFHDSSILTSVVQALLTTPLVIADLTHHNPNVFYEMGIRHFVRKPIILIRDERYHADEEIPFDIKDERVITFDSGRDGAYARCRDSIEGRISELGIGDPNHRQVTPISKEIGAFYGNLDERTRRRLNLDMLDLHFDLSGFPELVQMSDMFEMAGLVAIYKDRDEALDTFKEYLSKERREIFVIGSSLKGFLRREDIAEILQDRLKANVRLRFLLTHPAVADLRADQEDRNFTDIGKEIIASLQKLAEWRVPEADVKLYKGAPTIFAIKTSDRMLLNPYAYSSEAYTSPCFIVQADDEKGRMLYDAYDRSHFGAWDGVSADRVRDYKDKISLLTGNLNKYKEAISRMLNNA